ncbi:hypothetical protein ACXWOR_10240, partial [Streptococcus pyogenes]
MQYENLTRDKTKIMQALSVDADPSKPVICKKEMKVVFPMRYVDRGMATIGSETSYTGIAATVCDDAY